MTFVTHLFSEGSFYRLLLFAVFADLSLSFSSTDLPSPPIIAAVTMFNAFLNSTCLSDVKFRVDGKIIPAHKLLLAAKSPAFNVMFCGELVEQDHVNLPDCEYEGMLEFLRFLYTEEVDLSGMNVMQVLYLAEKYMVPSLTKRCNIFLNSNLDTSNVFSVLKHADLFSNDHLASDCWYFVDKHAKDILSSAEFFSIERSVLEKFVARDMLNVEELVLFKAVDCWAVKECERQNLEVEGPVKRQLLEEEIIKSVRFPVMKKDEFMDVIIRSNILTKEEYNITEYLSSPENAQVDFLTTPRIYVKRSKRNFGQW